MPREEVGMSLCGERECGSGGMSHAVDVHRERASTLRFRDQLRLPGEEVAYSKPRWRRRRHSDDQAGDGTRITGNSKHSGRLEPLGRTLGM